MPGEYNLIHVLRMIYSWRRPLIGLLAGVGIVSALILLLTPNYYQAKTVFYAASEDLFKPNKIFGGSSSEMYYYGSSDDINRILTIGTSNEFLDTIIREFDLYQVYNIDTSHAEAGYTVRKRFFKHYNILRTKYDAIELTFEDKDPVRAANIANGARNQIQENASRMIKNSQKKLIDSYTSSIVAKESLLRTLGDSLASFQYSSGVYDPDAQAEYLSTQAVELESKLTRSQAELESFKSARNISQSVKRDSIAKLEAQIKGLEAVLTVLNDPDSDNKINLKRFSEARGVVNVLDDAYKKAINQLSVDKEALKKYQSAYDMEVPAIHILSTAEVPVKKSRPRRSIILLTILAVTAVFSVIAILLIESSKQIEWKQVFSTEEDNGSKAKSPPSGQ